MNSTGSTPPQNGDAQSSGAEWLDPLYRPLAAGPMPRDLIGPPPEGCLPFTAFVIARVEGFADDQIAHIDQCPRCDRLRARHVVGRQVSGDRQL